MDCLQGRVGEQDGAVAVRLKVNTDVKEKSSVVQMLDSGRRAFDWKLEILLDKRS